MYISLLQRIFTIYTYAISFADIISNCSKKLNIYPFSNLIRRTKKISIFLYPFEIIQRYYFNDLASQTTVTITKIRAKI